MESQNLPAKNHTVLIIEDDHNTRVTLREALESRGYQVLSAANGADGLELLTRPALPCVIVLDQHVPVLDGEQFLKIKNSDPKLRPVPVIVISSHDDKISHLGAVQFMAKPIALNALMAAIDHHCHSH